MLAEINFIGAATAGRGTNSGRATRRRRSESSSARARVHQREQCRALEKSRSGSNPRRICMTMPNQVVQIRASGGGGEIRACGGTMGGKSDVGTFREGGRAPLARYARLSTFDTGIYVNGASLARGGCCFLSSSRPPSSSLARRDRDESYTRERRAFPTSLPYISLPSRSHLSTRISFLSSTQLLFHGNMIYAISSPPSYPLPFGRSEGKRPSTLVRLPSGRRYARGYKNPRGEGGRARRSGTNGKF